MTTNFSNDQGTGYVASDGFDGPIGPNTPAAGAFTTLSATGVVSVANGTAAAPEITFTSDTDTGFYRSAANTLGIATGGAQALLIGASGIISFNVGAVGTPSLTFTGDLDTGLYWIGANSFGLAANGVVQCTITTGGINGVLGATTAAAASVTTLGATGVITHAVGAVGAPSLTFSGDTDTGLYWISANSFGLAANGVVQATITTAGINGILGGTTPAAASVTTIAASGSTTYSVATAGPILKQGANGLVGTFVANGSTPVTVSNSSVAISDCIIISLNTVGGTVGVQPHVATITGATGFTVVCTASDTSTYNYCLIKNAA